MIRDLLRYFNWIDLFVIIVLIRATFVGFKRGAIGELFFTIGVVLIIVLSIQYYNQIGVFLNSYIKIPFKYATLLSYIILIGIGFILIWLLSKTISIATSLGGIRDFGNKILGTIIGIIRGGLICSILFYLLTLLNIKYLSKAIEQDSFSGLFIMDISFKVYNFVRNIFI